MAGPDYSTPVSQFKQPVKKYCQVLGLKSDPRLLAEYEHWHKPENIWPEVVAGLRQVGILDMEIFRSDDRLFMILTVPEDFDFEKKMEELGSLPRQAEWESFMSKYQDSAPGATSKDKWKMLKRVFHLPD